MLPRTFKELFASVKPDRPASPALSRAQRLAKVAPAVAAEVLEGRRLLTGSAAVVSNVLVVNGDSSGNNINILRDAFDGDVYVEVDADTFGPFDPANITSASVSGLGGADQINIEHNDPGVTSFPTVTWIDGGDGNDTITAGDSSDTIHGGNGNDEVHGEDSADTVYGDDDDDLLYGEAGNDVIYGGVGYDTVYGDADADLVYGGTGSGVNSDSVTGYDVIYGGAGNDSLHGEGGGDSIYGNDGADSIRGGDFGDFIQGGDGADSMYGDEGDDTINANDNDFAVDILFGGNGNDCGWWQVEDSANGMEGQF